ncbi:hypothetical protein BAE30_16270 [Acidithiobacillus caldus]|uniref:Uncharacterized protein n=1 Tax=Acidithiobacillus caldus TaxID=33059 RepID=A0A1E7YRI6_9PROT|nr:hypothetical protein BAE30_16270 [Acidithiobacillus caldus]
MSDDSKIVGTSGRPKPPRAGMGRPAGVPNKTTRALKQALEESFERLGGVEWLVQLAATEPKAYAGLLAKLLPTQIDADVTAHPPITEIRRVIVDPKEVTHEP